MTQVIRWDAGTEEGLAVVQFSAASLPVHWKILAYDGTTELVPRTTGQIVDLGGGKYAIRFGISLHYSNLGYSLGHVDLVAGNNSDETRPMFLVADDNSGNVDVALIYPNMAIDRLTNVINSIYNVTQPALKISDGWWRLPAGGITMTSASAHHMFSVGWGVAIRFKAKLFAGDDLGSDQSVFSWSGGPENVLERVSNYLQAYFVTWAGNSSDETGFYIDLQGHNYTGGGVTSQNPSITHASPGIQDGDDITLMIELSYSKLRVAANGGAFEEVDATNFSAFSQNLMQPFFELGGYIQGYARQAGAFDWCFTANQPNWTDADSASVHALGSSIPTVDQLPHYVTGVFGFSSADLSSLATQTSVNALGSPLQDDDARITRMAGLLGENVGLRNADYSGRRLMSYDLYVYDSAAHALTNNGVTGVVAHYHVANTYNNNGNLVTSSTQLVS